MSNIRTLKIAIGAFAIVGVGLFFTIFLGYLGPTENSTIRNGSDRPYTDIAAEELADLQPGEDRRYLVGGSVLGLYRPTDEVWEDLEEIAGHVYSSDITTYFEDLGLFVYWRHAPHCGIVVSRTRKGEDEYDDFWLGGYIDEAHSSSFDYAGRAIKTHKYSLRGFTGESRNLEAPEFEIRDDGSIRIPHTFSQSFG